MVKRFSLGILEDPLTDQVPGTVRLLSPTAQEPLGVTAVAGAHPSADKRTPDGKIILNPQPDDHPDDPLNWKAWRRDAALLTLGWHCLVGGGQTPVLAAGFKDVAATFDVSISDVALTTGLYMMGLGIGAVLSSPTAILYGKRPVYLAGVTLFLASSIWAASAKSYGSLVVARIVMGIGVSPCESLPSATIAEIFFLHERAYRIGIYTLLLLGGKNLVPLVSAVIIQAKGWRWVFWVVSIIVGFNLILVFFFVPETFWDRTPRPNPKSDKPSFIRRASSSMFAHAGGKLRISVVDGIRPETDRPPTATAEETVIHDKDIGEKHAHFAETRGRQKEVLPAREVYKHDHEKSSRESLDKYICSAAAAAAPPTSNLESPATITPTPFIKTLKPYNGRLRPDSWLKAATRPFILFAYPAILWSTLVYSLSVGWLIVLSESVASIYQSNPYNFSRLSTGLIYLSPFIGGILGTAVAGKLSDIIVTSMARRNNGIYEPEFRLIMAIPIALTTSIGLIGFGWSAQNKDSWIIPTVFFGFIAFGCSLGSTTAITYCVDSYRQYAAEALVTLNFSKNIGHGLVFSLFFNRWLEDDGSRRVFLVLGGVQLAVMVCTVPMYVFGKRARMWTVRKGFMDGW